MVDIDDVADRAVREGWSWGLLAEHLCGLRPDLDPARTHAALCRAGDERASLGPVGATKAAVRAALATAKAA